MSEITTERNNNKKKKKISSSTTRMSEITTERGNPPLISSSTTTMSEITTAGESPMRENQLQVTKYSQAKIPRASTTTRKARPFLQRIYKETDLFLFRSTRCSPGILPQSDSVEKVEGTISYENSRATDIEAYYSDMQKLCLKLTLKRPCPAEYNLGYIPPECVDCLAYCTLFPKGYEIEGDTLVQLWMAAGLINEEPMEEIGAAYLRALRESDKIISFSREDYGAGKIWFQVNVFELSEELQYMSRILPVRLKYGDHEPAVSKKTPCHVTLQSLPTNYSLEKLERFPQIRAILLLRDHDSNVDRLPYDFFMTLKYLQALDLSGTRVSDLPTTIENAKCLCYLDLSDTPIKRLPETIDSLQNLQTLKLQNCPRLVALPKGTTQVTSLRHLDLGNTFCRLRSMPPGIGALTCLRTLSNFIVGEEIGCHIGELRNMSHLGGRLCLSRLEHVASLDEAREANLSSKQRLTTLELQWTDDREEESTEDYLEDEVIEHLRPHTNLQHLRILCYGGSTFPSWMSDPCFNKLVSITLFKCENCQLLPSLGQLPELLSLSLIELVAVEIIDSRFCTYVSAEGDQFFAFPRLQKLVIKSLVNLREWRDISNDGFAQLTELIIKDCPKLGTLCRLSNLCSLEHLEINCCGKLSGFPEGDLPESLTTVVVQSCPLLSLSYLTEDAKDRHKMELFDRVLR